MVLCGYLIVAPTWGARGAAFQAAMTAFLGAFFVSHTDIKYLKFPVTAYTQTTYRPAPPPTPAIPHTVVEV